MRPKVFIFAVSLTLALATPSLCAEEPNAAPVASEVPIAEILREVPLIDGHNDLIIHYIDFDTDEFKGADSYDIREVTSGQSDIPRMRQGMLGGAIFTIWTQDDNDPEPGLEASIALLREIVRRSPDDLAVVTTPDELLAAHASGRIAMMMGLEGGNPVEGDIGRIGWMRERGVAEMGLVWSTNGLGAAGRLKPGLEGLTDLGKQVVREMNRVGMIIDVSHATPATVRDVAAITTAPLIDSHSVAGSFTGTDRSISDASMLAVAASGGVVMPMYLPEGVDPDYAEWIGRRDAELAAVAMRVLGEAEAQNVDSFLPWPAVVVPDMEAWIAANPAPTPGIERIADLIDYVRDLVGIDHVGIGSDFDGMGFHPSSRHPAISDVSRLPALLEELRQRGWSDADLKKLAGENFLRVWREVLSKADG